MMQAQGVDGKTQTCHFGIIGEARPGGTHGALLRFKTLRPDMDDRDEAGRFLPGNRFWEARSSAGPKPIFATPEELWAACVEYFNWVEENPLHEAKAFAYEGKVTVASLPKMRAMTLGGLCLFLDITDQTWRDWRDQRSDLLGVITRAEAIIYQQKFTGAAADLLNPNIIARDLGLADKQEVYGATPVKVVEHVVIDPPKRE